MRREECFFLGRMTKTSGLKGHLTLTLDTDHPDHYVDLDALFLDVGGELVPYFVEEFLLMPSGKARVKLEEVDSIDHAKVLTGKEVHLPLSALPELEEGQFYYHDLPDAKVCDKEFGEVGVAKWVEDTGAQPLLIIDREGLEILVPLVNETIDRFDKATKTLHLIFPPGLIEMYIESEE